MSLFNFKRKAIIVILLCIFSLALFWVRISEAHNPPKIETIWDKENGKLKIRMTVDVIDPAESNHINGLQDFTTLAMAAPNHPIISGALFTSVYEDKTRVQNENLQQVKTDVRPFSIHTPVPVGELKIEQTRLPLNFVPIRINENSFKTPAFMLKDPAKVQEIQIRREPTPLTPSQVEEKHVKPTKVQSQIMPVHTEETPTKRQAFIPEITSTTDKVRKETTPLPVPFNPANLEQIKIRNESQPSANLAFDLVAEMVYLKDNAGNEVGTPTVGQQIYFYADWRCDGSGTTPSFRSEFKLDGSLWSYGTGTATGGYGYTSYSNSPWTATAGQHTLERILDVNNNVVESNENNNTASKSWNTSGALDLVAERAYLQDSGGNEVTTPTEGQSIYFYADWQCDGSGTTPSFRSEFRLDGSLYAYREGTATGGSSYTTYANSPWTATAGSHTLEWILDVNTAVAESNENNNTASQTWTTAGFDLVAERAYLKDNAGNEVSTPSLGQEVYFYADWRCDGSGTTPSFRSEFRLDSSLYGYGDGTATGGSSYYSYTGPWTATSGSHTLEWILDVNDTVSETNENNNTATKTWTTTGFDLVAESVHLKDSAGNPISTPTVGQAVYFYADWRCDGSGTTASFRSEFRLNGSLYAYREGTAIGGGSYMFYTTSPWIAISGTHTLEWILDVNDTVSETDENNNAANKNWTTTGFDLVAELVYLKDSAGNEVSTPSLGQEIYFYADWRCDGSGTTPSFRSEFRLDGALYSYREGTAEGGGSYTNYTGPWTATAGSHTLERILDINNTVAETNENNNIATKTWNTSGALDLVAERAYLKDSAGNEVGTPTQGQAIYFYADWRCDGSGTTPNFRSEMKLDGSLYTYREATATGGTSYTTYATSPWTATAGSHTLEWILDVNSNVSESNETNNTTAKTWITSGAFDLVAERAYLKDNAGNEVSTPTVGQAIYFYADWRCDGSGTTASFRSEFRLDGALYSYREGTAIGGDSYSTYATNPWTATAGSHTLEWKLDVNNAVAETNENNNIATKTWNTTGALDLVAERAYLKDNAGNEVSNPTEGQAIYFYADWRCDGSGTTPSFRSEMKLDGSLYTYREATATGGTSYTTYATSPWTATAGSHTLEWELDVNNTVAESNENNNTATKTWTITTTQADLMVESYGRSASEVTEGSSYWIKVRIKNNGAGTANTSYTKTYLSLDKEFNPGIDHQLEKKSVPELPAGSYADLQWNISSFPDLSSGDYSVWIIFELDCDEQVAESNENNNIYTTSNSILVHDGFGITIVAPNGGETWQIGNIDTIKWTSSGTSGNVKIELSRDGGTSWETPIPSTPDDHSQPWTVTGPASNNCKVRITDVDGNPSDISDNSFTISSGLETVTYNFPQQGWYLISLPITPTNNSLSVLFPTAIAAFAYNSTLGNYEPVTALETKKGYWLTIPGATTSTLSGTKLSSYTAHYTIGWHLIGSIWGVTNFTDPADNPNGSVIAAYGYDPNLEEYFAIYPPGTGQLEAKQGYWLAAAQSCDLTITGSMAVIAAQAKINSQAFYQQYGSQPPKPPFITDRDAAQLLPDNKIFSHNYPNPFNPETVIEYALPRNGFTQVHIYNSLGQRIRTLLEAEQSAGVHRIVWDGRNDNAEPVANGIYFYHIKIASFIVTKKMLLLR